MTFFNSLNYSSSNEDGATELSALQTGPGNFVACITGSGDRPLHQLLGDPARVLAFDANAQQNHLLRLKMAGMIELDYGDYLAFLGILPAPISQRSLWLDRCREHLNGEAFAWTETNRGLILKGIIYQGRWEKYFAMSSLSLHFLRSEKIRQLFAFTDVGEQAEYVKTHWNNLPWRVFLRFSFHPFFFRWVFGDPGFYSQLPRGLSTGDYIASRMADFLCRHLAIDSFMMALVFFGRFFDPRHYPLHLQEENFKVIKGRLDRLEILDSDIFAFLGSDRSKACNKFSLSDVSSFLNKREYLELFENLGCRSGIRFCMRDFLTQRRAPETSADLIHYDGDFQKKLMEEDLSFGYTFIVGST